jgi:hypothetical protein
MPPGRGFPVKVPRSLVQVCPPSWTSTAVPIAGPDDPGHPKYPEPPAWSAADDLAPLDAAIGGVVVGCRADGQRDRRQNEMLAELSRPRPRRPS